MRVIVLKKNRSNKRGTPTTARDIPPKKSLVKKELFVSKVDPGSPRAERKLSAATAPSMKTKWLKAIKSLKPASGSAVQADRRNGAGGVSSQPIRPSEDGSHHLQEYTYKKITACDVCSQILRGHTRQGLRCRICKLNAHGDCAGQLPRCQPKQKLLRRQKSTSELENRIEAEEEIADLETENTRPFGEPLMLKKKILVNSNNSPHGGSSSSSTGASRLHQGNVSIHRESSSSMASAASASASASAPPPPLSTGGNITAATSSSKTQKSTKKVRLKT